MSSSVSNGFILSGKAQKYEKKLLENNREDEKLKNIRNNGNSNKKLFSINNYSILTKLDTNINKDKIPILFPMLFYEILFYHINLS